LQGAIRIVVTCKVGIIEYLASGEYGGDRISGGKRRVKKGRKGEEKKIKKRRRNWGRKRKVEQDRAKQIDIWAEWKREIGKNKLQKYGKK
jgi:hypothetical protein